MALSSRHFGMTTEELTLWCASLSIPQVRRRLAVWEKQPWPRHRPPSPRLRAFQVRLAWAQDLLELQGKRAAG